MRFYSFLRNWINRYGYHGKHIAEKIYIIKRMQRTVFTNELCGSIFKYDVNRTVIYRQNSRACGDSKHNNSNRRKGNCQPFCRFYSTEAKHHHQQEKRQKYASQIGDTVCIKSTSEVFWYGKYKISKVTKGNGYKNQNQPGITLFIRRNTYSDHAKRYKSNYSVHQQHFPVPPSVSLYSYV